MSEYGTAEPWCPEPPPEDERAVGCCHACNRGWHHDCWGCGCACNADDPGEDVVLPTENDPATCERPGSWQKETSPDASRA